MNVKNLQIFLKVIETGNISAAAKELNYVQSNVTARIQKLEDELNTALFHRHNRGMTLTPEGKKLQQYAEKIVSMVTEMKKAFHDTDMPIGKLDIGTVETVIQLPYILSKYNKKYRNIDLTLTTGVTDQLIDDVLHLRIDGAFVTKSATGFHPDLEQYEVFEEELVLISDTTPATLNDLKQRTFLVFGSGCGYRARLQQWLEDEQVGTFKKMEFGTLETILGSVYSGLGVSIVPRSAVRNHEERGLIQCHSVPEKYSKIETVFIRRKDTFLTTSMEKFIETIVESRNNVGYSFSL